MEHDWRCESMTAPLRNLPVMQNWDCHGCSDCCRIEAVITGEEKQRIEALDLANDPEVAPGPWFAQGALGSNQWRLAHRPDGGCVFLTSGNRCRLEERFGAEVKPFVCRLFPFVLIPAGNHWRSRHAIFMPVGRGQFRSPGGRRGKGPDAPFALVGASRRPVG